MNKDLEYEKFTKSVYQDLLDQEGVTVGVQHNVRIKGKATSHQIDVFWEFELAGVNHKVIIECKNYNRKVSVGILRDFQTVLSDIGNVSGILVTTEGFQSGAIKLAEYYGIKLVILRKPKKDDWTGKIRALQTNISVYDHSITDVFIQLDFEWFRKSFPDVDTESVKISFTGMNNEILITDYSGNKIKSLLDLENELPIISSGQKASSTFFQFSNAFIKTKEFGKAKIEGVKVSYVQSVSNWKYTYDSLDFTRAIVKDVLSGEMKFIKYK